jgi:flagellar biosynthesis protein FlhF
VLSTTTRRRDLDTIIHEYARIPFDKVVLTKVDESTCFGEIFTLLAHTRVPLSYLTTGQRTPEDIELASAERIVDLVMAPWAAAGIGAGKDVGRVEKGVS